MTEQAKKSKKRTSFLTMLVIAILIALVGVQLIHLRSQIDDARSQLTALQSDLDTAKQENDALSVGARKGRRPWVFAGARARSARLRNAGRKDIL